MKSLDGISWRTYTRCQQPAQMTLPFMHINQTLAWLFDFFLDYIIGSLTASHFFFPCTDPRTPTTTTTERARASEPSSKKTSVTLSSISLNLFFHWGSIYPMPLAFEYCHEANYNRKYYHVNFSPKNLFFVSLFFWISLGMDEKSLELYFFVQTLITILDKKKLWRMLSKQRDSKFFQISVLF